MIRFEPDSWLDAVLRPIAMAAPDGGVYIEIMAPDMRFAMALALLFALGALTLLGRRGEARPRWSIAVLLITLFIAFAAWLFNTGNGRYFIAFLLVIGPLCIALVHLLPVSRGFRLALAGCAVAVQGFAVYEADPVKFWALSHWRESTYFQLEVPPQLQREPAVYATVSSISYSLVAPQFASGSGWINIATATADREKTAEGRKMQQLLTSGLPVRIIMPSVPEFTNEQGLPDAQMLRATNLLISWQRLALAEPAACQFLPSTSLAQTPAYKVRASSDSRFATAGFWVCDLRHAVVTPPGGNKVIAARFDDVFERVESTCPRFFRRGEAKTKLIPGGELRHYSESDMDLYVTEANEVWYKYKRALNAERIGRTEEVLAGVSKVDCTRIRGRSGLPWQREL